MEEPKHGADFERYIRDMVTLTGRVIFSPTHSHSDIVIVVGFDEACTLFAYIFPSQPLSFCCCFLSPPSTALASAATVTAISWELAGQLIIDIGKIILLIGISQQLSIHL